LLPFALTCVAVADCSETTSKSSVPSTNKISPGERSNHAWTVCQNCETKPRTASLARRRGSPVSACFALSMGVSGSKHAVAATAPAASAPPTTVTLKMFFKPDCKRSSLFYPTREFCSKPTSSTCSSEIPAQPQHGGDT
jgi:hypothetical protein